MNTTNLKQRIARWLTNAPKPVASGEEETDARGWYRNRAAGTMAPHLHVAAANRWRDAYNPLRSLTMPRAVSLLEAGKRGEYAELQWLYAHLEETDPVLSALISRYEGGLLKLDWDIKTREDEDSTGGPTAAAQRAALREAYEKIDNLRDALQFLVLARFRGFAHLEKWFNATGTITHLEPVAQWYWVRDGINGAWEYNREANSAVRRGEPIDPRRFLIRECARPIDQIGLLAFWRKNLAQRDWDAFVDTFGIPAIFVVGPPAATAEQEAACQAIVEGLVSDARGYLPNGAELRSVDVREKGLGPFKQHIDYQDQCLVLAGTCGKLTMLTEPGVGANSARVHEETWRDLVRSEAMLLSEVMQRQVDAGILAEKFPGEPARAWFELAAQEETDVAALCDAVAKLSQAGYQMNAAQLSEKTGYLLRREPTEPFQPQENA